MPAKALRGFDVFKKAETWKRKAKQLSKQLAQRDAQLAAAADRANAVAKDGELVQESLEVCRQRSAEAELRLVQIRQWQEENGGIESAPLLMQTMSGRLQQNNLADAAIKIQSAARGRASRVRHVQANGLGWGDPEGLNLVGRRYSSRAVRVAGLRVRRRSKVTLTNDGSAT